MACFTPLMLAAVHLEPNAQKRDTISVSMSQDLGAAVRAFAERRQVTISSVVAVALSKYLRREGSK